LEKTAFKDFYGIAHFELNGPFYFHDWLLINRKWPYLGPTALKWRERELSNGVCDDRVTGQQDD